METVCIAAVTAAIVSVILCNISAVITFRVMERYVQEVTEEAKKAMKSIRDAYITKRES